MAYAVSSDGVRIAYEVVGHGPPLLLYHGFSGSGQDWQQDVVPALRDNYQLILLDARGHGQSDKPHEPAAYAMAQRVADVVAVLDALGIARTHFWGYSMGGRVGFGVGALAPEHVSSFILGGSYPFADAPEAHDAMIAILREGIESFLALWERAVDTPLSAAERQQIRANDADALLADRLARRDEGGWELGLARLTVPCLVYAGDQDEPEHTLAQRAVARMPRAVFLSLPGCDHGAAGELSDLLRAHVRAFLERASAGPACG